MKHIFTTLALAWVLYLGVQAQSTVTVIINNIEKAGGKIEVGLYDSPTYWLEEEGQYYDEILACSDVPTMTITIPNVEYGTYSFSLYHDMNDNGKMDFRGWMIPREPYGFSNNPKAKWSKPSFKKCSFEVNQPNVTIEVDLQRW